MEIHNFIAMEIKRSFPVEGQVPVERIYRFEIPVGSPYGELYDVLSECLIKVTQEMQNAAQAAKPSDSEEAVKPEGEQAAQ